MTADEHVRTARSFLEQADREFEIGDELQGSEKMWGAARHAIAAVAQERGWDFGKHGAIRSAVRRLADEREDAMLDAGIPRRPAIPRELLTRLHARGRHRAGARHRPPTSSTRYWR